MNQTEKIPYLNYKKIYTINDLLKTKPEICQTEDEFLNNIFYALKNQQDEQKSLYSQYQKNTIKQFLADPKQVKIQYGFLLSQDLVKQILKQNELDIDQDYQELISQAFKNHSPLSQEWHSITFDIDNQVSEYRDSTWNKYLRTLSLKAILDLMKQKQIWFYFAIGYQPAKINHFYILNHQLDHYKHQANLINIIRHSVQQENDFKMYARQHYQPFQTFVLNNTQFKQLKNVLLPEYAFNYVRQKRQRRVDYLQRLNQFLNDLNQTDYNLTYFAFINELLYYERDPKDRNLYHPVNKSIKIAQELKNIPKSTQELELNYLIANLGIEDNETNPNIYKNRARLWHALIPKKAKIKYSTYQPLFNIKPMVAPRKQNKLQQPKFSRQLQQLTKYGQQSYLKTFDTRDNIIERIKANDAVYDKPKGIDYLNIINVHSDHSCNISSDYNHEYHLAAANFMPIINLPCIKFDNYLRNKINDKNISDDVTLESYLTCNQYSFKEQKQAILHSLYNNWLYRPVCSNDLNYNYQFEQVKFGKYNITIANPLLDFKYLQKQYYFSHADNYNDNYTHDNDEFTYEEYHVIKKGCNIPFTIKNLPKSAFKAYGNYEVYLESYFNTLLLPLQKIMLTIPAIKQTVDDHMFLIQDNNQEYCNFIKKL